MDDDIYSDLSVLSSKTNYGQKKTLRRYTPDYNRDLKSVEKPQPLTTKIAVKFLLEGRLKSKVCRYCLNITAGLSELDQIMKINGTGNLYKVTIRDIVASFHPFKVVEDPNFPNKICQKCLDKALGAYLFTQQCERAERAMLNCFEDMYEKFEKLDPIDRPKKRGRQKLNPNYNVLHAEHEKVIDYAEPIINIINTGAETLTKEPELNEFECKKCWQVLPNMESLLNHEKIHPKTMWYHCRLCGKSFPKRTQLKKHNHRVHVLGKEGNSQLDTNFKCKECDHVTDNFVQHLQHMEKHKFRSLMEHIIEKKMDTLCVICFNKGSKLNELDKMVCIHGGHPDLMGDKTLYHVLASTLPNPKSYKYQELLIPSEAQIMTISKRTCNSEDTSIKKIKPCIHSKDYKDNFLFSCPVVVSKNRFKTDHFYFYVFCDPENHINTDVSNFDINANEIEKSCDSTMPKLIEVIEIGEIRDDNETPPKRAKICPSANKTMTAKKMFTEQISEEFATWAIKTAIVTRNINKELNITGIKKVIGTKEINSGKREPMIIEEVKEPFYYDVIKQNLNKPSKDNTYTFTNKKDIIITEETEPNIRQPEFTFSKPEYFNIKNKKIEGIVSSGPFTATLSAITKPENIVRQNESLIREEEKAVMKCDDKRLIQDCNKCWVFNDTCELCKSRVNAAITFTTDKLTKGPTACKMCWIFKNVGKCEYCRKGTECIDETKKVETGTEYNNNTESVKANKDKVTWHCNVCLTNNNTDRITCYCCGTIKPTEYNDIKISFGNNNTFFQKTDRGQYKITEIDKEQENEAEDETNKFVFIEEATLMDCKSNSEEAVSTTNVNLQSMDVESNAAFNIKEVEQMEVEETPINVNSYNAAPLINFNITSFVGDNIPSVGTSLQFNIGCVAGQKMQPRKIKKVLRNIPKTFHK